METSIKERQGIMKQKSELLHEEIELKLAELDIHNFALVAVDENGDVFHVTQVDDDFAMKVAINEAIEEVAKGIR